MWWVQKNPHVRRLSERYRYIIMETRLKKWLEENKPEDKTFTVGVKKFIGVVGERLVFTDKLTKRVKPFFGKERFEYLSETVDLTISSGGYFSLSVNGEKLKYRAHMDTYMAEKLGVEIPTYPSLPEEVVTLPCPPWVRSDGSDPYQSWLVCAECFKSERNEIVREWLDKVFEEEESQ